MALHRRTRRSVPVVAALFALILSVPAAAQADEEPAAPAVVPEGSVLATPSEVAQLGGSRAEVAEQKALWASLSRQEAAEQRALSASERKRAASAFRNIEPVPDVVPLVSPQTCGGASYYSYYKIVSDSQPMQCFAGAAGTYTLTTTFQDWGNTANVRLQAAERRGRVYYSISNGYYWSTTRGPGDYNWYTFEIGYDHHLTVRRVQLY